MKTRRRLLVALAGTALAGLAHGAARVHRVGILGIREGGVYSQWKSRFPEEFASRGFVEGRNLQLIWYDVVQTGSPERMASAQLLESSRQRAIEMAAADLDCMVANGEPHARLLLRASSVIPIVVDVPDPVGFGFAKSLAHPGGNVTGLHGGVEEVALKTLEIFRRLHPKLSCMAWIGGENFRMSARPMEAVARAIGLRFHDVPVGADDAEGLARLEAQLRVLKRDGCEAAQFAPMSGEMTRVVREFALKNRFMVAGGNPHQEGILFNYSARRTPELSSDKRVPAAVSRILRGERPGDIPFEGPSHYDLALNLRTAARLGIPVPRELLLLANETVPA